MEKKLFARYPIGNPRRKWRQDNFILSIVNPGPMQEYGVSRKRYAVFCFCVYKSSACQEM